MPSVDDQRRVGQGEAAARRVRHGRRRAGQRPAARPAADGEACVPLPVAVRLAVVMPLKASDMPSVDDSDALVKV